MKKIILGVDIGGTSVKIGFVLQSGDIFHKWEIPTNVENNGQLIVQEVWASVEKNLLKNGLTKENLLGIGVGAPGFINEEKGLVYRSVNIGWENFPLSNQFEDIANLPVYVANDANVAALGENWQGAGQQANNLLAVTLGTGVGGGVIVDGTIVSGENGTAGEIGHIIVDPNGHKCNCGRNGCLETITSATGIVRQAIEKIEEYPNSALAIFYKDIGKLTAKDIFDRANNGDELCESIVHHTANILGFVIANIATVINPSKILIGGGVSQAGDDFIKLIENAFKKYALDRISAICSVETAQLGNDAGLIGAAYLVKQHMQN